MKNSMTWNFNSPLGIKIIGSGEYVKEMCCKLVDLFAQAEQDNLESLRQDYE